MKYLSFNELSLKLGGRSRSTIYRDVELGRLKTDKNRRKNLLVRTQSR